MFKLTLGMARPIEGKGKEWDGWIAEKQIDGGTHASFFDMVDVMNVAFARGEANRAHIEIVPEDLKCPKCGQPIAMKETLQEMKETCLTKR